MSLRHVAIVTGGRPDYGLFLPLLRALSDDSDFKLSVVATGMHLMPEQGETWRDIERDGFTIAEKVDLDLASDSPVAIAQSVGIGVAKMAGMLSRVRPDILVLLGDRFESLAAAVAAMIARIPIAHIHGGESTEGLIDEAIRHSISKMSQLHFTATEEYRRRVIQLGEQPSRVFCVGAIGLDNVRRNELLSRSELEAALGVRLGTPTFLVTLHPVTLEHGTSSEHAEALIAALDTFPDAKVVMTLPNADTDSGALRDRLETYVSEHRDRATALAALGTRRYLSLLAQCDVVIGNSSSGLIEAPSFHVPTVNIGDRQRGRIAPRSVIHCASTTEDIRNAIVKALASQFRAGLAGMENPYGDGRATPQIVEVLRRVKLDGDLIKKRFYDLPANAA